jgi:LacI family transcriptional regulator
VQPVAGGTWRFCHAGYHQRKIKHQTVMTPSALLPMPCRPIDGRKIEMPLNGHLGKIEKQNANVMSSKTVTLADIARVAGVSKNTVSLALRQSSLLSCATRERIAEIASTMGYKKNPTLAHLMVELRSIRKTKFKATLALLNANVDRDAIRKNPSILACVEGCHRRASSLGYVLDNFWLHDPDLDATCLSRIFRNRGIRGAIVVGLRQENRLPADCAEIWDSYPSVVTGVRTHNPTLPFTATDQYGLCLDAVQRILESGYKRPALVLDQAIDTLVEHRYSAGFQAAQQQLSVAQRIRPHYLDGQKGDQLALFRKWYEREKPDVILTPCHIVKKWLADLNWRVPTDVGLIQLEWRPEDVDCAGMDQHNDLVGEAAVDMLIGMIHENTMSVAAFPQSRLIGSTWIDGKTVKSTQLLDPALGACA